MLLILRAIVSSSKKASRLPAFQILSGCREEQGADALPDLPGDREFLLRDPKGEVQEGDATWEVSVTQSKPESERSHPAEIWWMAESC